MINTRLFIYSTSKSCAGYTNQGPSEKKIVNIIEYTLILQQGNNCRQFSLLFPLSFIGQFVHSVGRDWMG